MEWREITGWPYEVSSEGQVRRVGGGVLKGIINQKRHGYRYVVLRDKGRRKDARVCILVCEAFHGPRPADHEAAHANNDPADDRAENLSWKTCASNHADKIGHDTWGRKLNNERARAIKHDTRPSSEIAAAHGVSIAMVCRIRSGRSWAHV